MAVGLPFRLFWLVKALLFRANFQPDCWRQRRAVVAQGESVMSGAL
jgi:hypothetical protein